jgi:hypothetical protein
MTKIPNIKVKSVIGFTDEEINELKKLAKEEISFRVSFRKRKQKYAAGTFDLRPYGNEKWTEEEYAEVESFMINHKLTNVGLSIYDEKKISNYKLYNIGFNTTYRINEYEEIVIVEEIKPEENKKDETRKQLDKVRAEVSYTYDLFVRASASRSGSILKKLLDLKQKEKQLKELLRIAN